jgi:hypothetical protein
LSLPGADSGPSQPQLLVAVLSEAPLQAFKVPGRADEVFVRALKEARDTGQALKVSARYLKPQR